MMALKRASFIMALMSSQPGFVFVQRTVYSAYSVYSVYLTVAYLMGLGVLVSPALHHITSHRLCETSAS